MDKKADAMTQYDNPALSAWVEGLLEKKALAGCLCAVYQDGRPQHRRAYGTADLETQAPLQDNALFRTYSLTKPMTSILALMAIEEGKFALHTPLADLLPEFASLQVYDPTLPEKAPYRAVQNPPTIFHLLTHTAGFSYEYYNITPVEKCYQDLILRCGNPDNTLTSLVKSLSQAPLQFEPGTHWGYGYSTDVLGAVLERTYRIPFADLMQEKLFTPLGMKESGFWAPPERRDRLMTLYGTKARMTPGHFQVFPPKGTSANPDWVCLDRASDSILSTVPKWTSPGGGLVTTLADYQQFLDFLLARGMYKGMRLLSESSVRQMTTQQLWGDLATCRLPTHPISISKGIGFGLGLAQHLCPPHVDRDFFWSGAANTFFLLNYEKKRTALFVTQMIPFDCYPFFQEFRNIIQSLS